MIGLLMGFRNILVDTGAEDFLRHLGLVIGIANPKARQNLHVYRYFGKTQTKHGSDNPRWIKIGHAMRSSQYLLQQRNSQCGINPDLSV